MYIAGYENLHVFIIFIVSLPLFVCLFALLVDAVKMLLTKDMLLLCVTFIYTGVCVCVCVCVCLDHQVFN